MANKRKMEVTPRESLPELFLKSRYASLLGSPRSLLLTGTRKEIRARLRNECPASPGVYGMVSSTGQLIYVGMSRHLCKRLHSYFSSKVSKTKERRIGYRSATLVWQPAAHELVAALRERELIRHYRPNYNVQGHPTKMRLGFLTLVDQPAPAFTLHPHIPKRYLGIWGPMPMTRFLRQAVAELNHHFLLRDCPKNTPITYKNTPVDPDAVPFSACMRAHLKTCLAPCVGGCTKTAYTRAVNAATRFLDGDCETALAAIAEEMKVAVTERKFERAAVLRDRAKALERISLHLRRFHDWTSKAYFIYPIESSIDQSKWWMLIERGTVVEVVPQPHDEKSAAETISKLNRIRLQMGGVQDQTTMTGPDEFESTRLLFRWFRLRPDEKEMRLSLSQGKRVCQSISK
ncbi:GIY-YIG nuclease family protein [Planctomicrobium sp. SH668]|uniref:GIY-YIG nuclease family protein n=1 Tax=Planctomicrobium sp. SH668 TaxID=3448126 RepID=UPI003F5B85F6